MLHSLPFMVLGSGSWFWFMVHNSCFTSSWFLVLVHGSWFMVHGSWCIIRLQFMFHSLQVLVHVYGSSGLWFIIYKQSVFVFNSSYFVFSGSLRSFQLPFWFFSVCHTCLPWNYLCKDMFQYASLRPHKNEAKKLKGEKRRVCHIGGETSE